MKKKDCTIGNECCVTGDTRILTPMGMERIDALYLRARHGETVTVLTKIAGELQEVAVKEVHTDSEAKELFKVTLDDGCHVTLSGYHRMAWIVGTWLPAESVVLGDRIDKRKVKSIKQFTPPTPMQLYDLELCEGNGYIANGIMVRAFVREIVASGDRRIKYEGGGWRDPSSPVRPPGCYTDK